LRLPFRRREAKLDVRGALLLSASIGTLMIGLEEGRKGWTHTDVLILFAVAVVGLVAFIVVEQRVDEPMIPLRLFRNKVVLYCILLGMCAGVATYGAGQFLPLYFQDSLFWSPTVSGLAMAPQMAGVSLATFGIGRLIARTGRYKAYPIAGTLVGTAGLLAVAQIDGTTTYIWLLLPMMAMGFGAASVFTTTSIASQNAVEFADL
ncbi:MAG: MFS transporter, partial [Ilumatobacter sp.]|nr:MFS transporter [Ilumatobacter sp.]